MKMRKIIYLTALLFLIASCGNNSSSETEEAASEATEMTKEEENQKLVDICVNMDGVVDADIMGDILTIRANITQEEAQKLSDGMLSQIQSYREDIKTVQVLGLDYSILGYSGEKK
jgi:hypothetical protein